MVRWSMPAKSIRTGSGAATTPRLSLPGFAALAPFTSPAAAFALLLAALSPLALSSSLSGASGDGWSFGSTIA